MREMKDSGVEWIGEIPADWNIGKTLYALSMPITDGPHETPELFDEGIPFVSAEAVSCGNGHIDFEHIRGFISQDFYEECCKKYIPEMHDIYMIKSGATTGKVAIVETQKLFTIWSPLAVFRTNPKKCFYEYLYYFIQSDAYQKQIENKWTYGTQQNIGMRTLEKLMICFPSIDQQINIADYLDIKCSKIDEIIEKQQVIIEKLKEYKLSIITEAVTKGLNPDVEMKDSGNIEIGKIPSISRPTKLKYLCNTQGRIGFKGYTTTDLVDEGEGAYTLGASHLNNGKIDLTDPVFISWEKYYESPEIMVKQNDILIVQRGSTIGKVAIVDKNYGEVTINPSLVLINKIHIDSKYLLYALSARYIANYINLIGTTTAIPMINQKQINDLVVIVPPDSIQISVVKYLDEKCGKIDANILKKQKLIEKFQEYKKSLIYGVVTGKKEV